MIGSLVMPHNIYLHSALVRTRRSAFDTNDDKAKRLAVRYHAIEGAASLLVAVLINVFVMAVFAAGFHGTKAADSVGLASAGECDPVLCVLQAAPWSFVALRCSSLNCTATRQLACHRSSACQKDLVSERGRICAKSRWCVQFPRPQVWRCHEVHLGAGPAGCRPVQHHDRCAICLLHMYCTFRRKTT